MLQNAHALLVCVRTLSASAFIHPSSLHLLIFNLHFKILLLLRFTFYIVSPVVNYCVNAWVATCSMVSTFLQKHFLSHFNPGLMYIPSILSVPVRPPVPISSISLASQRVYGADLQQYIPSLNSCFI